MGADVRLDEETIDTNGSGGTSEIRGEDAIASGIAFTRAGALDTVGGVENDGITELAHFDEPPHVDHEIVVAKGGATFSEEDAMAAGLLDFADDGPHVAWSEELPFFDIDGSAGGGGCEEEVGLAAKESGYLEDIGDLGDRGGLFGVVDIGKDGEAEGIADLAEEVEAFFEAWAAERIDGGAVGLVETGLKNEGDGFAARPLGELFGDFEEDVAAFNDAGSADKEKVVAATCGEGAKVDRASGFDIHVDFRAWR